MPKVLDVVLASVIAFAPIAVGSAFAADTGGSDVPACKKGTVYDKKQQKCVTQRGDGAIDDDSLYSTGRRLAIYGRYDEAIAVLGLAENKDDPKILTYLGYAHRKAGRVLVGVGYYEEALRISPDFLPVREYYGEAQLQLGNVAAARVQLAEIEKRGGRGCEEYLDLAEAIEAVKS